MRCHQASHPAHPLPTHACSLRPLPLQLYRHAGVAATGFQGVPLFQAEVRAVVCCARCARCNLLCTLHTLPCALFSQMQQRL